MIPESQLVTLQTAVAATGNGTVAVPRDYAWLIAQISGTFSATITWEGTLDGTNWEQVRAINMGNGALSHLATSTGLYAVPCGGFLGVRARVSTYGSGAVTVTGILTTSAFSPPLVAYTHDAPETGADGLSNTFYIERGKSDTDMRTITAPMQFNESTWDRIRGNTEAALLASAARTETASSPDQTNYNARGVIVTLDVTAVTDTPELTLKVEAKMGSNYEALLTASAAVADVGVHSYIVYPGVGAAAGDVVQVAGFPLPRTWRVTVTHAASDSATYNVTASVIL